MTRSHRSTGTTANMVASKQEATYCLAGKLKLPGDILCLRATDDGKLASGGESCDWSILIHCKLICKGTNGTKIWNLKSKKNYQCPAGAGVRGATTVVTWIRHEDVTEVGLVYRTQAGFLVGWKEIRKAEGVSALKFFS